MASLETEVRRTENLYRAWTIVRSNVLSTGQEIFRNEIQKISENPIPYLRKLQHQLSKNAFTFEPQRGVLKKTSSGKLRPIVVAPVRNRIVQRAILNVLQSEKLAEKGQLGQIGQVIRTPSSVGGVPKRGVGYGIELIRRAINNGAKYYLRSDIKQFFTQVPSPLVCNFVKEQTGDASFSFLFELALKTELSNADEVSAGIYYFPTPIVGVPQGSSLSAFAGNVVLREFDARMNGRNIETIRYIDDFVILGRTSASVRKAFEVARSMLNELGMAAYSPEENDEKARYGLIEEGFDFLGCTIRSGSICPSKTSRIKFLEKIRGTIQSGLSSLDIFTSTDNVRRAEDTYYQTLVLLDDQIRGWGDAFSFSNERLGFHQLDAELERIINPFIYKGFTLSKLPLVKKRRSMGIALLQDTPLGIPPEIDSV